MRHLFERLKTEGAAVVAELIADRAQEGVQLDFKEKKDARSGTLDREDRQTLGRALSAMANSMGGLLVYGVVAKKDKDGIDAASAPAPISELRKFQSEVTRAVGDLLMPRHDEIEVAAISEDGQPDTGYMAIWVARSERRPHRCEAKDDKHYYKRAGDSSFMMEHYDIEDAFKRFSVAKLGLALTKAHDAGSEEQHGHQVLTIELTVSLINESNVTALYPYIRMSKLRGCQLRQYAVRPAFTHSSYDPWHVFSGGSDTVVHPGMQTEVVVLATSISRPSYPSSFGAPLIHSRMWTHLDRKLSNSGIAFDYMVGCKDAPAGSGEFVIEGDKFKELLWSIIKSKGS